MNLRSISRWKLLNSPVCLILALRETMILCSDLKLINNNFVLLWDPGYTINDPLDSFASSIAAQPATILSAGRKGKYTIS